MKRVTTSILVQVDQTDGMRTSPSHFDLTLHGADTVATVENVDAIRELFYTPHIAYSVLDLMVCCNIGVSLANVRECFKSL